MGLINAMNKLIVILILAFQSFLYAQTTLNFKIYYQKKEDTITLLVDNQDPFPYSFEFDGQPIVENMRSIEEHFETNSVIEGNTFKKRLAQFVPLNIYKPFEFKKVPKFIISKGNIWNTTYDANYEYDLPFKSKEMFLVAQGYDGSLSHRNQNALDFEMPLGTEVLAAREGIVMDVKQDSYTGCPDISCAKYGNYIKIIHTDGTIAEYYHIQMNGSKVKAGDTVQKGQTIALSGNTGWSTGPHLHFMCYLPRPKGRNISLKTLFRINNGKESKYLIHGNKYKKNY